MRTEALQLGQLTVGRRSASGRLNSTACGSSTEFEPARSGRPDLNREPHRPEQRAHPHCEAHDLDNLYVVDTGFFPSSSAVNASLTAIANALRVGDHLLEWLAAPYMATGVV